jgi:hypothetical protein
MMVFGGIPAALRAMKRLWQGVPGMAGLVARREREAVLFEVGLGLNAGIQSPAVANPP